MFVVGIDASTNATGICGMQDGRIVGCTFIDLHTEKDTPKRVKKMLLKICSVLDKYEIDEIHMEKAFSKQNVATTMLLANLAGGVMLYAAQHNIKYVHPEPSVWRKKIGIEQGPKVKREMLKAEAIEAVKREYDLNTNDDVSESILLARSAFDLPKLNVSEDNLWEK